jgi:competence protein ComEC
MGTPVITITVSYIFGIILGEFLRIPILFLFLSLILSITCSLFLLRSGQKPVHLMLFSVLIFGIFACQYSSIVPADDISRSADDRYVKIIGPIADEPSRTGDLNKFTLKAKEFIYKGVSHRTSGYVGVYVSGSNASLSYGNRVLVRGKLSKMISTSNPGISSLGDLMAKRKIGCQMFVSGPGLEVLARTIGNPVKYISIIIKNKLISVIQSTMDEPYASLLGSVVFGSQASPLSNDIKDNYKAAGVIHFLIASGTQVSILIAVLLTLCRAASISQNLKLIVVTLVNVIFAGITGAGPSIIRAAVMSEFALVANVLERENDFYNSLFLSALILLIIDPLTLFDMGFQLTFLGTWALFYAAPVIEKKLSKALPPFLAGTIALSVAPTIMITPVTLYNFGQVSFISVVTNFFIIPWVEVTVILGFVSTMTGLIFPPIAYVINNTLTVILAILNGIVFFLAGLPFACRYFSPPVLPVILAYYMVIIGGIEMLKGRMKFRFKTSKAILLVVVLILISIFTLGHSQAAGDLTVTCVDVGQGDSILIESPSGKKVLIDGGGRQEGSVSDPDRDDMTGRSIVVPFLRKKGINELDLVVLTHPHEDHVGGLPYVLDKLKVDMVLESGQTHTSRSYYRFLKLIEQKHIPYMLARAGQVIDLGAGVKGYVLNPSDPFISGTISDLNNNSVVIRLVYGRTSFLLMGDAAFEAEDRMLSSGLSLKSDVLKVGHHGSRTSTSDSFLDAVRPRYAVISVGARNKFGHPSQETLERLSSYGIKVFRTDLSGAVIFKSDGSSVWPAGII